MKRYFLITIFMMLSVSGQIFGQSTDYYLLNRSLSNRTRVDKMFNSSKDIIYHTHIVTMQNGSELSFEIASVYDYEDIRNLDSIVADAYKNILLYKDSIAVKMYENIRIDYLIDGSHKNTRLRYVAYPPTSDMFISRKGEVSKLKVEQDTIRIRILRPLLELPSVSNTGSFSPYIWNNYKPTLPMQITFLLNNYTDLGDILSDYELNEMVDTFYKITQPKRKRDKVRYWLSYKTIAHIHSTPTENISTIGMKYGTYNEGPYHAPVKHVNFYGNIGAGLLQNKIAPVAEGGIEYRWLWTKGEFDYSFLNLNVSPYFLFDKHPDGTYHTYDSWFINFYGGASTDNNIFNLLTKREYFGASYLLNPDDVFFKRITVKIFMGIQFRNSVTIVPELLFTDNCKSIFPGITVKIF